MFTLHTPFLVQIIMGPSFICCVIICRTAPNKMQILHSFVYGTVLLLVERGLFNNEKTCCSSSDLLRKTFSVLQINAVLNTALLYIIISFY